MSARGSRRGVLFIISGLLIGSGLLRIGGEASQAFANAAEPGTEVMAEGPECLPREEIAAILGALDEREDRVARRELQLADRLQALRVAETEIEERLTELKTAEADLAATLAQVETAAESDLERLVQVYESMKPADAAALFQTMSPEFSAGFIGRMNPGAAAAILTGLEPDTAYTISVILAGRNANTPRN